MPYHWPTGSASGTWSQPSNRTIPRSDLDQFMFAVGQPSSIREAPGRDTGPQSHPARGTGRRAREANNLTSSMVQLRTTGRQSRLIREWGPGSRRPIRSWLSNIRGPAITEVLPLVSLRRLSAHALGELRDFGLNDFESRSYPGWHHHMTLVSVAAAYSTLLKVMG